MAAKAGVGSAALDAHRHEVFLRVPEADGSVRELLAGPEELATLRQSGDPSQVSESRSFDKLRAGSGAPDVLAGPVAVCDEATESLLKEAWPGASLARTLAPRAADAIEMCVSRILAGRFADLALLDGHYLRRSDAEIFGGSASKAGSGVGKQIRVRRMRPEDLDGVMGIAAATPHAPGWHREAYGKALDLEAQPRRVALVAEDQSGALVGFAVASLTPPEAELESIATAAPHQRRGMARELFSVLKAELRRQGTAEVMLEVREANHSALEFYRFLGFREEGRRKSYYADPVEDAVLMRLRLR
jgi:ribosomal-protein-alanine acetyltransferase